MAPRSPSIKPLQTTPIDSDSTRVTRRWFAADKNAKAKGDFQVDENPSLLLPPRDGLTQLAEFRLYLYRWSARGDALVEVPPLFYNLVKWGRDLMAQSAKRGSYWTVSSTTFRLRYRGGRRWCVPELRRKKTWSRSYFRSNMSGVQV